MSKCIALPPNVRTALLAKQSQTATAINAETRINIQTASNYVRLSLAKSTDEPSPASARAVDKVLRLPNTPAAP